MSAPGEEKKRAHAVHNGKIRHLSVSQIKTFMDCERKWVSDKVLHLPGKVFASQEIGKAGHAQIEHYLKTGEDVLGPFAAQGKHLLPAPGPDLGVELKFFDSDAYSEVKVLPAGLSALTAAGIQFEGSLDLANPRKLASKGILAIDDHKFSGDPRRYGAGPSDLLTTAHGHGVQMVGYMRWAFLSGQFPGLKFFQPGHNYFRTKGSDEARKRDTFHVDAGLVKAHAFDDEWARIEKVAERMKEVAADGTLGGARANWDACNAYGGCPYRANCLSYQTKHGRNAGPPRPSFGKLAVAAQTHENRNTEVSRMGLMNRVKSGQTAAPIPTQSATPAPAPAVETHTPAPVEETPAPVAEAAPVVTVTPAEPEVIESKPKRTRRTKAELQAEVAAEIAARADETVEAEAKAGRLAEVNARLMEEHATATAPRLRIFVGTVTSFPTKPLAKYVEERANETAASFELEDLRMTPQNHPLGYGKWKAALAANVKANPPAPGDYSIHSGDGDFATVVLEALETAADEFVRGTR